MPPRPWRSRSIPRPSRTTCRSWRAGWAYRKGCVPVSTPASASAVAPERLTRPFRPLRPGRAFWSQARSSHASAVRCPQPAHRAPASSSQGKRPLTEAAAYIMRIDCPHPVYRRKCGGSRRSDRTAGMTGVTLEAMGVPAAALCSDRGGKLVVEAANGALLRLLGGGGARVTGASAEALLPRSVVAAWTEGEHAEPVDTRLGSLGLPHRAIARALPPDAHGGRRLLATFLPTATLPMPEAAGLAPSDLGATALEILDMQGEMVSRWRLDGTIVYCNEAFARQCGRELDAVIGANLFELTPAHEIEQIKRNVAGLSPTMPSSSYDHHIPVSEQGERWQEWIDRPIFDEVGRMVGYLSVGRDITARKLAERRLAESERRLKLALEAGRQGVWELDFQTRQVEIDRALEQLLRLPPGAYDLDVEGAGETYHPDDQERVRVAIEAVIRGETDAYRIEARRRLGDGGWCWVLNFGRVAERDDSGRPLRMVGTTIDINQRKQAELDLSDREQRLRLALEAGSLGVWECELASERIHYDAICLSRLGWGAERCDWALAEAIELVHVRDRAKVRQMFAQFRRGDRGQARVEFRMRRRDGGYAWIEEHAQVSERSADGLPTQLVGVSADITARKE